MCRAIADRISVAGIRSEECIMNKKEKLICGGIASALWFVAANVAGTGIIGYRNTKKLEPGTNAKNSAYSCTLGKYTTTFEPDTLQAYLTCTSGCLTVDFPELPTHRDVYVDLFAACSKVVFKVPGGARIEYAGEGLFEKISDKRENTDEEWLFTIHISRKSYLSKIEIAD